MGFGSAESFETVALYTGLLLGKMAFVSALLAFTRLLTDTFSNPEDAACSPRGRVSPPEPPDPRVQRLKWLLLSDMEDILPHIVLSFLYLTTNPTFFHVMWCCRIFFTARVAHTFGHVFKVEQPFRLMAYLASFLVNLYLIVNIVSAFLY